MVLMNAEKERWFGAAKQAPLERLSTYMQLPQHPAVTATGHRVRLEVRASLLRGDYIYLMKYVDVRSTSIHILFGPHASATSDQCHIRSDSGGEVPQRLVARLRNSRRTSLCILPSDHSLQ